MDTVYEEISQEDPQYKLLIMDVNAEPKEYWTCIFKYVPAREDFWICLNMGYRRIKPGDINDENFVRELPPSYSSLEVAIIQGKELLKKYVSGVMRCSLQ